MTDSAAPEPPCIPVLYSPSLLLSYSPSLLLFRALPKEPASFAVIRTVLSISLDSLSEGQSNLEAINTIIARLEALRPKPQGLIRIYQVLYRETLPAT